MWPIGKESSTFCGVLLIQILSHTKIVNMSSSPTRDMPPQDAMAVDAPGDLDQQKPPMPDSRSPPRDVADQGGRNDSGPDQSHDALTPTQPSAHGAKPGYREKQVKVLISSPCCFLCSLSSPLLFASILGLSGQVCLSLRRLTQKDDKKLVLHLRLDGFL